LRTLPETDATLEQIIRFARTVDPTGHFQDRWGEEYRTNVQALWHRCVQSYKDGSATPAPPDELLMCLAYDVVLGPHLGVPHPHKLPFLRWLIDGVRQNLWRDGERA
jgi:hypothetical protein